MTAMLALQCSREPLPPSAPTLSSPRSNDHACANLPTSIALAPGVSPAMLEANFWLTRLGRDNAQRVVTDSHQKVLLQQRAYTMADGLRWLDDPLIRDAAHLHGETLQRWQAVASQVATGSAVEGQAGGLALAKKYIDHAQPVDEVRGVLHDTELACLPLPGGIFRQPKDPAFDRNRCSMAYAGALVRVLGRTNDQHFCQVHAEHASGWLLCRDLSPVLPERAVKLWREAPLLRILHDDVKVVARATGHELARLRLGSVVPLVHSLKAGYEVLFPGQNGLEAALIEPLSAGSDHDLPLTRDDLFHRAFDLLDTPYAWGGSTRGRDCSRYLLDLLRPYGIYLPRHSAIQAQAGLQTIELHRESEINKRKMIRSLARDHVVLLFMPGHIMLYLGAATDPATGREDDYALSAISEIAQRCGSQDVISRLDKVTVTPLETGRNTAKGAFLVRITAAAVF